MPLSDLAAVRLFAAPSQRRGSSAQGTGGIQGGGFGNDDDDVPVGSAFRMSKDYEGDSESQLSIAGRVIKDVFPAVVARYLKENAKALRENKLRLLDIACGPGVITVDLLRGLESMRGSTVPNDFSLAVDGFDIDNVILKRARTRSLEAGTGSYFHSGDFRQPPEPLSGAFDLLFSTEGLHWTGLPPAKYAKSPTIFYGLLPSTLRREFDRWGEDQWRKTFRGLAKLLSPGGFALLQFGSEGQLNALYRLMGKILSNGPLKQYQERVWFSLFYPKPDRLARLSQNSGLDILSVDQWEEPLTEQTPEEVVGFVRGWTEPYLHSILSSAHLTFFYEELNRTLTSGATPIDSITWQRTVVVAKRRE